jgi:hypothetical protein
MKINYKLSVIEQIVAAQREADRTGKEIESLELTPGEWVQLKRQIPIVSQLSRHVVLQKPDQGTIHGIPFTVKQPDIRYPNSHVEF